MPLVLPFGVILAGFIILGLALTVQVWAKAMLHVFAAGRGGGIIRIITLPLELVVRIVTPGVNFITHELTKAGSHLMHPLAHWFDGLAEWSLANAVALGLFAERTALGFERLTTVVLPREIGRATRPLERKLTHAARVALGAALAAAALRKWIERLWTHEIHPALHRLTHAIDVTIPRDLGRVERRVKEVETQLSKPTRAWLRRLMFALLAAGLLGQFVKLLARKFPWLFCRQVNGVGRRICSLDSDLLSSLLADTLLIAGIISVVEFAKSVETFMDVATPAIKGFVRETTGLEPRDYLG